ncbi:MAG TPA: isoprenylcysteine carboxylmethyltransferase family protein [Thermoanaerobaculia bacterium]|jgi:protein-S-isoprenylcysteine O-methyltransferase Ste14
MGGYGNWPAVIFFSAFFIIFAMSFARPATTRDWRSFGAFTAFIVALFVEMYGFPLTLYLLSGWLASRFPEVDFSSHESGHLWHTLLNLKGMPHSHPVYLLASLLILGSLGIVLFAWIELHAAQTEGKLATTGLYALVRHPQYDAFILLMLGYLLTWPTFLTLLMFPILVIAYVRLARREEREAREQFGQAYERYAAATPAFIPGLRPRPGTSIGH